MRRLPGKKFRTELFNIEGVVTSIDVRVDDKGVFFANVYGEFPQAPSLAELKKLIHPILLNAQRVEWDPYIQIEFEESHSRFSNHQDTANRQEITLEFSAGWMTRTKVSGYSKEDQYRWADAEVDPNTRMILEASQEEKRNASGCYSKEGKIPFTADRWQRLEAIAAALADVRAKLFHILSDDTAALLDIVQPTSNLLAAMPEPEADTRSRKGRRS